MIHYKNAKKIRFSCAYLFRIYINGQYFLVKDEQGRNTFQPVGGVYKYIDDSFFEKTHAVQCMRFGNNSDLDCDLRVIIPRSKVSKFMKWYKKEKGRETQKNLYREFQEEILDRTDKVDKAIFETIEYRCCGQHIETSRMGENDLQIRIADVVELRPTPQQAKVFVELMNHESHIYCFATKEDIYELGRTGGNQIQTISQHTSKILIEEEKYLKKNRHTNRYYQASAESQQHESDEIWPLIDKADISKNFTFISYNSQNRKSVWEFCIDNTPPLENIWIDRKLVSENWYDDIKLALDSPTCSSAILFVNKEYLIRSTACYEEAKLIVDNKIPHIVVLVNIDEDYIQKTINDWIHADLADKNKLRLFKRLFHYDDDTGHINVSIFNINETKCERLWQSYNNLSR